MLARTPRRLGFTLVETLVVMGVVALLLGITLPALQYARESARTTGCKANLASVGVFYQLYATDNNGDWPTVAKPFESGPGHYTWGSNGFSFFPVDQMGLWGYPLRVYVGGGTAESDFAAGGPTDPNPTAAPAVLLAIEAMSCPEVREPFREHFANAPPGFAIPDEVLRRSFTHSPALFTDPTAWANPSIPPDVNRAHARIKHVAVAHPSRKANLVETYSYHGSERRTRLDSASGPEQFNILACDGHVETQRARSATAPMRFITTVNSYFDGDPVLFATTADGARGWDW